MSEPDMIERVSRALCRIAGHFCHEVHVCDRDGDACKPGICRAWEVYSLDARAAIEAMRKPTQAMDEAGRANNYGRYAWPAWEAMLAAALSPTPPDEQKEIPE